MSEAGKMNLGQGPGMLLNQAQKAADSKEYLVEGAKLFCVNGSNITQLKLPTGHGYTSGGKKKVNCKDCKACENIPYFGECRKNEKDHKCEGFMDLVDKWENTAIGTGKAETVGGEEAISMSSVLLCKKGGVIIPVTSGQGYDGKINWAAFLKRYQNVFRWVAGKNKLCQVYGKDPINMNTGNYIYEKEDLVINGNLPLSFQLFYNAMDCGDQQVLGEGWNHNYGVRLIKLKEEELLGIVMEDGRELPYCRKLGDSYAPVMGDGGILSRSEKGYQFEREDGTVYEFDQEGKLYSQKDRNGNKRKFTYNSDGLLECVDNGTGGRLNYTYNKERKLIYVEDHTGRKISLIYQYGKLRWFTNSMGNTYTYEYNENGKLNGIITPRDILGVKNEYDGADRVRKQILPDGGVTEFRYDDENNRTYMLEQNGNLVIYECDKLMRNVRTIYEDGEEIFEYNDRNQKIRFTDKNGNTTRYAYDNRGNLTQVINALRLKTCMTYNEENLLVCLKFPDSGQIKFHYDEQGNLIETVNQLGYSSKAVYDGKGRVTCVIQPDNSEIYFDYDEKGNIVCFTAALGNKMCYEYDERNQMIREEDGNKNATCYSYNTKGDIEEIINAAGNKRRYEYNVSGKIITMVDFDGTSHHMDYDDCNNLCSYEDAEGNVTLYQYDQMGNLEKITYANGGECIYTYNHLNRLKTYTDVMGAVVSYHYDAVGNLIEIMGPRGEKTSLSYDCLNRRSCIQAPDGQITSYEYDIQGNISKIIDNQGNSTCYEYDMCGRKVKEIDILGNITTFNYNSMNNLIEVIDGANRKTSYDYYPGGLLREVKNSDGTSEYYAYDKNQNLAERKNQLGYSLYFAYDKLNQLTNIYSSKNQELFFDYNNNGKVTRKIDANGNLTQYKYSPNGNLISVVDSLKNEAKYGYDCMGKLTSVFIPGNAKEKMIEIDDAIKINKEQHNLHLTQMDRDLLGRILVVTDALGNKQEYEYDQVGNIIKSYDREGYSTSYTYDLVNNLHSIIYDDGKHAEFSYDEFRHLKEMNDWHGTTSIESDTYGRLKTITDYKGEKISYEFGKMGERIATIYPDNSRVSYCYDHNLRLKQLTYKDQKVNYLYDKYGRLEQKNYSNNLITNYNYDESGLLKDIIHKESQDVIDKYHFNYDSEGNKINVNKYRKDISEETGEFFYDYDGMNRLTRVKNKDKVLAEYEYDNFGNRCFYKKEGVIHSTYTYNSLNQLISENGDQEKQYFYDKRGNLNKIIQGKEEIKNFTFGSNNYLEKVEDISGLKSVYGYNGLGSRIFANNSSGDNYQEWDYTLDLTLSDHNLLEISDKSQKQKFIWDDNIVSVDNGKNEQNFLLDDLGSPIRTLYKNGRTAYSCSYDEFGIATLYENKESPIFGYTGYLWDKAADLYYAYAREYKPEWGRFISEDISKGDIHNPFSMNCYAYCFNSPLNYVDLDGEWPKFINNAVEWGKKHKGAVVAGVAVVAVAVVAVAAAPVVLAGGATVGAVLGGMAATAAVGAAVGVGVDAVVQGIQIKTGKREKFNGYELAISGLTGAAGAVAGPVGAGIIAATNYAGTEIVNDRTPSALGVVTNAGFGALGGILASKIPGHTKYSLDILKHEIANPNIACKGFYINEFAKLNTSTLLKGIVKSFSVSNPWVPSLATDLIDDTIHKMRDGLDVLNNALRNNFNESKCIVTE